MYYPENWNEIELKTEINNIGLEYDWPTSLIHQVELLLDRVAGLANRPKLAQLSPPKIVKKNEYIYFYWKKSDKTLDIIMCLDFSNAKFLTIEMISGSIVPSSLHDSSTDIQIINQFIALLEEEPKKPTMQQEPKKPKKPNMQLYTVKLTTEQVVYAESLKNAGLIAMDHLNYNDIRNFDFSSEAQSLKELPFGYQEDNVPYRENARYKEEVKSIKQLIEEGAAPEFKTEKGYFCKHCKSMCTS